MDRTDRTHKIIYLNHAATTKPEFLRATAVATNPSLWMNANSYLLNKIALDGYRKEIKKALGLSSGKVIFCRSASEAVKILRDNLPRCAFISSPYEHDSVWLERDTAMHNDSTVIEVDAETVMFFVQFCNQMTGVCFDIKQIAKQFSNENAFIACDLTASIGKVQIPKELDKAGIDALWFSGHKFGTENNIGALWISDRLFDYIAEDGWVNYFSRNEYGLVHGTPDVAGANCLTEALYYATKDISKHETHYSTLHYALIDELNSSNIEYRIVDGCDNKMTVSLPTVYGTYAIDCVVIHGVDSDALTNFLQTKRIYVSKGASACAEERDYRVLEAFGLTEKEAENAIRISFGRDNNINDIKHLVSAITDFKNNFC